MLSLSSEWSPFRVSSQNSVCSPHLSHMRYMPHPPSQPWFDEEHKLWSSSLCNFLHPSVTSSLLGPNILQIIIVKTPRSVFFLKNRPGFTPIQNNRYNYSFVYFNLYVFRQQREELISSWMQLWFANIIPKMFKVFISYLYTTVFVMSSCNKTWTCT
jgi:hypothetical protein